MTDGNAEVHRQLEEQRTQFESEKAELEHALADVDGAESKALELQSSVQEDLRRQARIAQVSMLSAALPSGIDRISHLLQEAHDKYERELMAHAESVQAVTQLKQQLTTAQAQARDYHTAAETAQANLISSETSWQTQRETLSKELQDLKQRYDDRHRENASLHRHLEVVTTQANAIRQAADSSAAETDPNSDAVAVHELRWVISYLRKEKDISDLQLDLNRREGVRLKSQVEQLTRSLEETRSQLTSVSFVNLAHVQS